MIATEYGKAEWLRLPRFFHTKMTNHSSETGNGL